jgi:hypothetical protein
MKSKIFREVLRIALLKLPNHPFFTIKDGKLHFSFVVLENSIISIGTNQLGSRKTGWPEHSSIHSEYVALKHAKRILNVENGRFDIINIRMNRNGELRNSKPCKSCLAYLCKNGVGKIYHTDSHGKFMCIG